MKAARLIWDALLNESEALGSPWGAIKERFQRVHPGALAPESKWEEWVGRVRADYRRRFASRIDEDLEPADPAKEEGNLRYEPDSFEDAEREYGERMQREREAHEKEQQQLLDALPVEEVGDEMEELVAERLADGVAGRSEEEWRSLLGEALDKRVEERQQEAKRRKARAYQSHVSFGGVDEDDCPSASGWRALCSAATTASSSRCARASPSACSRRRGCPPR